MVIPLYNKGPYIARTIDSVLAQTVFDFEIVIVDDGSTDNGPDVVATYQDDRIRLIKQENQGVSAARNRGISEASSDFIAFLDADDEWEADHLETLLRLRSNFPQSGAFATAYVRLLKGRKVVFPNFQAIPPAPWEGVISDYFQAAALGAPPVWTSAVAIPSRVFKEVGLFQVGVCFGEDHDMWGRIALVRAIAFSWKGVAIYRQDSESGLCLEAKIDSEFPFLKTVSRLFPEGNLPVSLNKYVMRMQNRFLELLIESGQKKRAWNYLFSKKNLIARKKRLIPSLIKIMFPRRLLFFLRRIKTFTDQK